MSTLRILTVPGSLRKASYNRKLLKLAESYLEKAGVELDRLDLCEYPLPPYDGDIEEGPGLPQHAWTIKARIAAAHGVIIACPEYNYSIPGTFKNVIDWTSRGGSNPWNGKVVGLMGASNGPFGTWRMMPQLRASLSGLQAFVIPQQVNVREAAKVWNEQGELVDEKLGPLVEKFVAAYMQTLELMKGRTA
ncbi:MAG TPA: NAD(P)H-dependent oxidoreductase [bacterium]